MPHPHLTSTVAADLFEVQTNVKLYHWKTKSYSRHKAADELHSQLQALGDSLIETMSTRYGRPDNTHEIVVRVKDLTDSSIIGYLEKYCKTVNGYKFDKTHTDLMSIRDDILAAVNKSLYLMSLN